MVNMVPTSGVLSTLIDPLYISITFLTIDNPSPLPVIFLVFSDFILTNSVKRFSVSSDLMPIPESEITIIASASDVSIVISAFPPNLLYYTAFDRRLLKTISISSGSAIITAFDLTSSLIATSI